MLIRRLIFGCFLLLNINFLNAEINIDSVYTKRYTKTLYDSVFVAGDLIHGPEIRWGLSYPVVQEADLSEAVIPYVEFFKKNPFLICELIVHTDTRGSAEANQQLSLKRAQSIVESILDSNYIFRERIIPVGKGESQPLIAEEIIYGYRDQKEKFERLHLVNRRIEIKIRGFLGKNFYQNRGEASEKFNKENVRNPAYYEDLILIADRALLEGNYKKALEFYSYAANMAPVHETYAAEQRDKIKALMSSD